MLFSKGYIIISNGDYNFKCRLFKIKYGNYLCMLLNQLVILLEWPFENLSCNYLVKNNRNAKHQELGVTYRGTYKSKFKIKEVWARGNVKLRSSILFLSLGGRIWKIHFQ